MSIPRKIIKFLEKGKTKYEIIQHKTVYTAFDKAQTLKVPEKMVGKTLILKTDGKLAIVLIPENKILDKGKFKKLLKAKKVELVSERLIKNKFKGVKIGAIPPFGNLWGLKTFIDNSLMREKEMILNSGDYEFSIKMKPKDFKKLVLNLKRGNFSKKK